MKSYKISKEDKWKEERDEIWKEGIARGAREIK